VVKRRIQEKQKSRRENYESRNTGLKTWDFAIRLLLEKYVIVVPGTGFGEGTIREGLKRIKEFVESL